MLGPGDAAPDFQLPGDDGRIHTLAEFAGRTLVLYFYPKDLTPGCTTEACDFRDQAAALAKKRALVVGVSPDPVERHARFKAKHQLDFLLLSDEGGRLAQSYGAWGEKVLYGKRFHGIIRSTFVIDRHGKILHAQRKVSPKGHAEHIVALL